MILEQAGLILLLSCLHFATPLNFEKPVAEKLWRQRCARNAIVLNDCNWCWCSENFRYTCNARVCGEVDMFGHFNDAIQDINVGMEGHGYWRTAATACEPGVHYSRGDLLCVCTEEGTWPSPVCRDTFRILHPVEVIEDFQLSENQKCSPTKLYLADCNICLCPANGHLNPSLCTQEKCTKNNFIPSKSAETDEDEIYAECSMTQKYKLGCKNCVCLRNNRLLCDNCTEDSQCSGRKPGENFMVDCNTCHCDTKGTIYCTLNRCLLDIEEIEIMQLRQPAIARKHPNEINCEPGTRFMKNCNTCYCFLTIGKIKKYGCTVKKCHKGDTTKDCEIGDTFNKECLKCHCGVFNNEKMEVCQTDPKCFAKRYHRGIKRNRENNMKEYKQECEPMHIYKNDCYSCECSLDGHTMTCTQECADPEPISLNIIPVAQKIPSCPEGHSYKIDCNFCICLHGNNAMCTTMNCRSK